jgi:AcrR family transcriptional regulator
MTADTGGAPIRRRPRRPAPARRSLYLAGRNIFAERGFHGTTVDAIVEAAGLAKGAFYHHWPSKDDLLRDIMLDIMTEQADLARQSLTWESSATDSLTRFIEDLFGIVVTKRKEAKIFHAEVSMLSRADFAEVRSQAVEFHEAARSLIARGIESGHFRQVESVELLTWVISGALSYAYRWWPLEEPHSPQEVGRLIADLLMPGVVQERPTTVSTSRSRPVA